MADPQELELGMKCMTRSMLRPVQSSLPTPAYVITCRIHVSHLHQHVFSKYQRLKHWLVRAECQVTCRFDMYHTTFKESDCLHHVASMCEYECC